MAAFLGALASLGSLNIPYKIEAVQSEWLALLPKLRPSCAPAGALDCPGRGCAWEAVYQLPAPTPGMLLFFKPVATHGGVCHAIQSLGSAFLGFPTGHALPPEATAVSEADPGESTHPPARWGETFLAPPIPPDFSLLGIISKSLRLFFFLEKKKTEKAKN